jgi:hypothetical protein
VATKQTDGTNWPTVAFRISRDRKLLIEAAALRRGQVPSHWLRDAVSRELDVEFGQVRRDGAPVGRSA